MTDYPPADELLEAVAAFLDEEVKPLLKGGQRFKSIVAANACRVVAREAAGKTALVKEQRRGLGPGRGAGAAFQGEGDRWVGPEGHVVFGRGTGRVLLRLEGPGRRALLGQGSRQPRVRRLRTGVGGMDLRRATRDRPKPPRGTTPATSQPRANPSSTRGRGGRET